MNIASANIPELRVYPEGRLEFAGKRYFCALGKSGITSSKREGDHATPVGRFPLRECFYRADRIDKPKTLLSITAIEPMDGWCDDPAHPSYNQRVRLPFPASHEVLWREDHQYDALVVLGHNDDPVMPGKGSAIFLHVAKPGYASTEGCVALALPDLLEILAKIDVNTYLSVSAKHGD